MDDDDNQLSILTSRKKYAVFISFRGEDTRSSFTSHLYKALISNGIETYIDDRLERGDQISKALLHAIDDSRFSLVIFSKNYASSSWCLDELVHIIKRMEKKKQIVLPVFYHVDPSDVRSQKGSYADAFVKRKKSYSDSIIQQWRRALTTASNLSGWHVSNTRNDAELVDEIVKHIRGKLRYTSSSTSNLKQGLVGIDKSIQDLCRLLSNAPIVGICGMGGLGKTTLAEVVFEQFRHQFDGHCFLRNVKEVVKKHGSTYLAQEFFGRLLSNKGKYIDLEDLDIEKERLYHKKLLIVLDDIENISEHDSLLRDSRVWLNSESKVIITSRNLQVLRNIIGDDEKLIYNLKLLDEDEALELFYLHALKKNKIARESCTEISRELVNYAQGLPLALIVLGRHLYSKREEVWQSLLMKLKVEPDESILQVLKMSFDGLDVKEKNIFLDIACFFRGEKKYYVKEILDDCGCFDIVIEVLVDKCLITICEGRLQMHDLLKEMGWSIARGLNNRLWIAKDICHVLRSNSATATIEGMFHVDDNYYFGRDERSEKLLFSVRGGHRCRCSRDELQTFINLDPFVFSKMRFLRFLKLSTRYSCIRLQFPHGLHGSFTDELRYLEWYHYPLDSLGSTFTPCKLIHLDMSYSQIEKLWNEFQDVKTLKYVILSHSKKLTCLPDLSQANLQLLRLHGCTSLVELPPIRFHNAHDIINAENESEVMHKYNNLMLQLINYEAHDDEPFTKRLEPGKPMACLDSYMKIEPSLLCYLWTDGAYSCLLDLKGCHNLTTLSQMSGNIKFLCLRSTAIQELDSSICSLNNLLVLDLYNCKLLRNLPNNLCDLESLEYLDLYGCILIDKFLELPKSIKGLDLSKTSIQQVNPSSFECLPSLNILYMNQCQKLESLPITTCKLESLTKLFLENCFRLKSFPEILEPMEKLKELYLMGTRVEELPSSIEKLSMLEKLCLDYCKSLKFIPTTICKLKSLIILSFIECWQLECLPEILEPMENLKELVFEKAWIEEIPSSIEKLILLEKLYLINCKHLKLITTNICKLKSLKVLSLYNCSRLKYFPEILEPMENLEQLYLSGTWIEALPSSIERLVMLKMLDLASCENLKSIPTNIYNMPKISEINISKYPKVKTLSYYGLPSLTVLGPSDTTAGLSYYYNSQTLQQSKCRSSCSITTTNLKVFFRLHSDDGLKYGIHFTCCECFLFYTVHNVLASQYFEDNIFQKYYNDFHFKDLNRPRASFSYSGNAIPLWFTNQSVGSSIEVNLVPSSDNYFSFLGFALCIVVDFDPSTSNPGVEDLSCEYIFKMSDGQSSKLCSTLPRQKATFDFDSDGDSNVDNNDILDWSSGNVFIWYLYQKDNWNYLSGVDKASFEFCFGESNDSIGKERIKQCGIRLVYRQDAKEFDTADAHSY